jgi:hypothetical protein
MSMRDALLTVLRPVHNLAPTGRRGTGPQAFRPMTG